MNRQIILGSLECIRINSNLTLLNEGKKPVVLKVTYVTTSEISIEANRDETQRT
jgi:hypothetical protein